MSSTTPNEVKSYSAYKKSGVEWLGNVPEHWGVRRIKSLSIVRRGASPRPIDDARYFDEHGEFAWVRISDVTASDRYLYKTTQRLSELGQSLSVELNPGSLFLSIAGSVGKPIITKIKCCIHDGFVYFSRFRGDVEFLYRVLSTDAPFSGLGKFGTQLNLNTDTVGNIYIGWPPSDEQAAIARYLDDADQRIRAYVSAKERLIALLEEERQAVIHQAVTRGLDPDVKLKPSGIEWLGDVPEHWEVAQFARQVEIAEGQVDPKVEPYTSMLTIAPNHVESGTGRLLNRETAFEQGAISGKYICRDGDVIYSKIRPALAKVTVAPTDCLCSADMYPLRPRNPLQRDYLFWLLLSTGFTAWSTAQSERVAMPKVNRQTLNNTYIPLPPHPEQASIAQYVTEATGGTYKAIDRARRQIQLMEEYRTRLIADVVTGKIDVSRSLNPYQQDVS